MNRTLRIGVDVRSLEIETSRRRGIGRYVQNMLQAMAGLERHSFMLLGEALPWEVNYLSDLLGRPEFAYSVFNSESLRDLDVLLLTDPLPLLTGQKLLPCPPGDTPCATIFYDLIPLAFQAEYLDPEPKLKQQYLESIETLRATVSQYLTISAFVASDLIERLHIPASQTTVISGGLDRVFDAPPDPRLVQETLHRLDLHGDYFLYTGGTDFRKNLPALFRAFELTRSRSHGSLTLALSGEIRADMKTEQPGIRGLGHVSDDDLRCLYAGALGFVFPSLYEGFGLPALEAMACGCPVIASNCSSLPEVCGDAALLVNPRSDESISAAMLRLVRESGLRPELSGKGRARSRLFTWTQVAERALDALEAIARPARRPTAPVRRMKVVIQNRPNVFSARGGDTVVMEELYRALCRYGVDVDVATGAPDLNGVDLVHLVNLTVGELTREVTGNARRQNVPYAITTLFEDWPLYMDRSMAAMALFREYLEHEGDPGVFSRGLAALQNIPDGPRVGYREEAEAAALLLACGESERVRLAEAYPRAADRIAVAPFGIRAAQETPDIVKKKIYEQLGTDRYVLICGRLETRKNQLMLLKALEDSDLMILLASGGFTFQPAYAELVRRFRRRGPVRLLSRVGNPYLRAVMNAALVHVLPSWYELPGLVSLEAASAGTAVVASDWGALRDYMPEGLVHYCRPDDPDSIRTAIDAALAAGPQPLAKETAESFTWERFGDATFEAYESYLSRRQPRQVPLQHPTEMNTTTHTSAEAEMKESVAATRRFDASIIIPVFNNADLTQRCLETVSALEQTANYEVIVVDNHSTDRTPELLKALEGDATVIRMSDNLGFAAACNVGARLAGGEYLIFLNNDTEPQGQWLDNLLECARSNPDAGAIGCKLLYPEGHVQHAGLAFGENIVAYHVFQNFGADHPAVNEQRDMQAVTAACMLVPRDLFLKLGGFDESYRNGFEDVDFCLRLGQSGRRVIYTPQAVVMHHEGSTEGRKSNDLENMHLFLNRWESRIRRDDRELLARFGYELVRENGVGTYRELNAARTQRPAASLDDARRLYAEGKLEEAAAALNAMVESRLTLAGEDNFETWQTLGNCLARLNRVDEAEKAFYEAIKLNGESERPYLGLGSLAMLQENWQAAMYGFMTALAKNPEAMKAEFGMGLSLAARNMHEQALERFQKVVEREPLNAEALFYLYRSAMESGHPDKAIEPLGRYLEQNPTDRNFLFNLCGACWKAGELMRAAELCQCVLDLDPNHAAALDVMEHLKSTSLQHA